MTSRRQEIEQLYREALQCTPDLRSAFLNKVCGDDEALRNELESLLAAEDKAGLATRLPGREVALLEGQTFGPYRIISLLGSGGMGAVYKARDSRLQRTVAIKILLPNVAERVDLRRRFQREAQAIATLNHPNICVIHDVGQQDGLDYLVMEHVEGETLAARIEKGPLPATDVIKFVREIADALDKVHRQGVVHRDLKPSNIMLTRSGTKLLDFGLAKWLPKTAVHLSTLPNMVSTTEGTILGTLYYMSPEQLLGKEADARSDIFSIGVIVYEMLTGQKAFNAKEPASVIAAILEREPQPIPEIHDRKLKGLDYCIRRCIAKDPDDRWQNAHDVLLQLDWLDREDTDERPRPARSLTSRGMVILISLLAAMTLAFLGTLAILYLRPPAEVPERRVNIVTPATPDPLSFAISPDGRRLVFVASGVSGDPEPRLWLRLLDNSTAQPLDGTEHATHPFWSADSLSIGFFSNTKLKRIDIGGGSPHVLADAPNGRGATWSSDGTILFAPDSLASLFSLPSGGGVPVAVTTLKPGQLTHRFPQFLPGGRKFLFYVQGDENSQGIYLGSLDTTATTRLIKAETAGFYAPSGWLFFIREGKLVAQRFDPSTAEVTGDPVTVADPVGSDAEYGLGAFSVSASGLITYRSGWASRRQLVWFNRAGNMVGTLGPADETNLLNPELSPEGERVAVDRAVQKNTDVWIVDAARLSRLTFDASSDHWPIWSPKGDEIVFDSDRKAGIHNLYHTTSGGAGNEKLLLDSKQSKGTMDWSPEGRFILYDNEDAKTGIDTWVLPMDGNSKPWPLLNSDFLEHAAQFSPDGKWVAYQSNQSGAWEIYIRPFRGSGGQSQVSTSGGISPRWSHDGKELYYIGLNSRLMAASIHTQGGTLKPDTPVALFQTRIVGGSTLAFLRPQYDVAPDGRFLINTTIEDAATSTTVLLMNWKPPAN